MKNLILIATTIVSLNCHAETFYAVNYCTKFDTPTDGFHLEKGLLCVDADSVDLGNSSFRATDLGKKIKVEEMNSGKIIKTFYFEKEEN